MDDTRDEVDEILAGMTGGRTGTAGGVSSPVPPAADWARGLDAASASAARLTVLLSDVYSVFCQVGVGRFGVSFSPCERRVSGRFGVGRSCWLLVIALVIA